MASELKRKNIIYNFFNLENGFYLRNYTEVIQPTMDANTRRVLESRLKDVGEYHTALLNISGIIANNYGDSNMNNLKNWISSSHGPNFGKLNDLGLEKANLMYLLNADLFATPSATLPIQQDIATTSPEENKRVFDVYQRYICRMPRHYLQMHFSDAMDYFKGKSSEWFNFCSTARALIGHGDIADSYIWQDARANMSNSNHFQTFAKTILP